jgi:hypothetical protein
MNEIPRLYHNNTVITPNSQPTQVTPARATETDPKRLQVNDDRRQREERRKKKKQPVIERRVSSDRRGPRFNGRA